MISPLLWEKIARGLSAGRVQSVAVKLVVEREREIRAFIPEEYWQVFADTISKKDDIRLEAVKQAGKTLKLKNKAETDALLSVLKMQNIKLRCVKINQPRLIRAHRISLRPYNKRRVRV
jgi:DNA topoisomerase-1